MRLACVAAMVTLAGCGKQSAASDLALATSASPPGVIGRPGFTVEIPATGRNDAVVVRIDEAKVPAFETIDLAKSSDAVSVALRPEPTSPALKAVAGRLAYNRNGERVAVWMSDVRFENAHGHAIVIDRRAAYYVPVGPRPY